jgi:hypothetical protein
VVVRASKEKCFPFASLPIQWDLFGTLPLDPILVGGGAGNSAAPLVVNNVAAVLAVGIER